MLVNERHGQVHGDAAGIRLRKVAIMVGNGSNGVAVRAIYRSLLHDGALPRLVGSALGKITASDGSVLYIETTLEAGPALLYDALVVPDGAAAITALGRDAHAAVFVREQYRHCKPIMVVGGATDLLRQASIDSRLPDGAPDPALIGAATDNLAQAIEAFKLALARQRGLASEADPV